MILSILSIELIIPLQKDSNHESEENWKKWGINVKQRIPSCHRFINNKREFLIEIHTSCKIRSPR